jgi:hypothetical protein
MGKSWTLERRTFSQGRLCMMILGCFILVQYDVNSNVPDELAIKAKLHVSSNNFNQYFQIAITTSRILLGKV